MLRNGGSACSGMRGQDAPEYTRQFGIKKWCIKTLNADYVLRVF